MRNFEIFAHRGGYFGRQNTIENFLRAYSFPIDGIETDICFSKDLVPIIYHPGTLSPDPTQLRWQEIRTKYPFVPCLEDLVQFMLKAQEFKCLLEIKEGLPGAYSLVELIIEAFSAHDLLNQVYITATDRRIPLLGFMANSSVLTLAKEIDPHAKTNVIATLPFNLEELAEQVKPDMISYGWINDSILSRLVYQAARPGMRRRIAAVQERGILVVAGIANTKHKIMSTIRQAQSPKGQLSGIVTDDPKLAWDMILDIFNYFAGAKEA